LLVVAALFVTPLFWMVSASLRPVGLPPPTHFELWPPETTFANYAAIFELLPFGRFALRSITVVVLAVPLTLLTASWAGFALSQLPHRLRDVLVVLSVASLLFPLMSLWLTRFLVYKALGLLDTLAVLIVPSLVGTSPFYVLILYWAFRRVPADRFEAARMDGCGALQVWWHVALPHARPALTAVGVLAGLQYWSDFIQPMLYINNQSYYTLPVALGLLQQLHASRWPILMAGVVMVTVPALLAFAAAQRAVLQETHESG
jgi:multiple sugar transport system permease protein